MSNGDNETVNAEASKYPRSWQQSEDYDPSLFDLKGKDYLLVEQRERWFIADQRTLIKAGLAQMPFIIRNAIVEIDVAGGYAHFSCYVRDVLGNEATMFGSETRADFKDFAEKAGAKAKGRALAALGYNTGSVGDLDERDRPVDAPVERHRPSPPPQATQRDNVTPMRREPPATASRSPAPAVKDFAAQVVPIEQQREFARELWKVLGCTTDDEEQSFVKMTVWLGKQVRGAGGPQGTLDGPTLAKGKTNLTMAEMTIALETLEAEKRRNASQGQGQRQPQAETPAVPY